MWTILIYTTNICSVLISLPCIAVLSQPKSFHPFHPWHVPPTTIALKPLTNIPSGSLLIFQVSDVISNNICKSRDLHKGKHILWPSIAGLSHSAWLKLFPLPLDTWQNLKLTPFCWRHNILKTHVLKDSIWC